MDVDDLPGADDDSLPTAADLDRLRETFRATPWANRRPRAVEVEVETPVDGYVLRCRIDAVFDDLDRPDVPDGVVVVDWKTGRPPQDPAERAARELQLAVYRLAWSRWQGLPVDKVRAAFCYVATGATVYPRRLLDEAGITALLRSVTGERVSDEPVLGEEATGELATDESATGEEVIGKPVVRGEVG